MSSNVDAPDDDDSAGHFIKRRFRCALCRKGFTKADHLAVCHLETSKKPFVQFSNTACTLLICKDSNQKPFVCPHCQKSFGRHDVMLRHAKLHDVPIPSTSTDSSPDSPDTPIAAEIIAVENLTVDEAENREQALSNQRVDPPTDLFRIGLDPVSELDTSNFLDILMSDFGSHWPLSLPVIPYQLPSVLPSAVGIATDLDSPGQQAMDQMSRLVGNLFSALTVEISSAGMTSGFLDTCIYVFFDKFLPSFPIIHRPTFQVQDSSHPLLLNIIALGSLFVVTKDSVPMGEALWKLAHTSVATSWQALMATKGPRDQCNGVQLILTALLGQTYALLSKNEDLRMTCQVFHGLGFFWAKQCGMFGMDERRTYYVPALDATELEKNEQWKAWATFEVQKRAILGHYILDGQISQFFGQVTSTRHVTNPITMPSSDAAFSASTADQWILEQNKQTDSATSFQGIFLDVFSPIPCILDQSTSNFSLQVILEGIQSLVADAQELKSPALGTPGKSSIARALKRLFEHVLRFLDPAAVETIELMVRWHTVCLNLATPTIKFFRSLCATYHIPQRLYTGTNGTDEDFDFHAWVQSTAGLRAVLHSIAIQQMIEKLPIGRSNAIHLPSATFTTAAIYSARCFLGKGNITVPATIDWPEVFECEPQSVASHEDFLSPRSDTNAFMRGNHTASIGKPIQRNLARDLNSLQMTLASISLRWGVSQEMNNILHHWISIANQKSHPNT